MLAGPLAGLGPGWPPLQPSAHLMLVRWQQGQPSDQRRERGKAFLASAQRGPSDTNRSHSRAAGPTEKLSTPLVDEFCTRTERSLYLAMAFMRREIYWVVKAVAFLLPPSPSTAQVLASWASGLRKNKAREASRGSQNQQATSLLIS